MFLSKLIILNNKCCKEIFLQPSYSDPEILLGVNDCGKSTILKSLEVFFDEKKNLLFSREDQQKNDLSNSTLSIEEFNNIFENNNYPILATNGEKIICIVCEFDIEESDLTDKEFLENSKNIQLKWCLNNSKKITIIRVFHKNVENSYDLSGYFILTSDFKQSNGEYLRAWNRTKSDLNIIKTQLNVKVVDIINENNKGPFKNIEDIQAIYKKVEDRLENCWAPYNFSKDKNFFPQFKYLDWNFSLRDLEDLATEAMKDVTEPLLNEIKELATKKQIEAIGDINNKFNELIIGLKDELPKEITSINSSVYFQVDQKITDITLKKSGSDGDIHLENQGDGIKRQIWFAILKWRSKVHTPDKRNRHIWCFDEPETHLYPTAQRNLFNTFQAMCENEFQIFLSTHSTIFIDRTRINHINKLTLNNGYTTINKTYNIDDIFDSLGLKNSDFLFFNKFIAIEGATEYELLPHLYKLKYGKSLIEDGIQLINLKGNSQYKNNKLILENILKDFQKTNDKIFYLLDGDSGTHPNTYNVGLFDIEDSIPDSIWIKFVKDNCEIEINEEIINKEIREKINNKNKFYNLLGNYIAKKIKEHLPFHGKFLPTKGNESGALLTKYFENKTQIPHDVDTFFNIVNE